MIAVDLLFAFIYLKEGSVGKQDNWILSLSGAGSVRKTTAISFLEVFKS